MSSEPGVRQVKVHDVVDVQPGNMLEVLLLNVDPLGRGVNPLTLVYQPPHLLHTGHQLWYTVVI
jgi:hypothetical protein